jgi:hypothetical protein
MSRSSKIQIAYLISTSNDLFAIDNMGRIWRRSLDNPNWAQDGEIPDAPAAEDARRDHLVIDAPDGIEEA